MSIQSLAGQTLGQYELRELLGEGGMGAVYRAYQRTLDREVAIKVLPSSLAAQSGYMERFTREARTAAALEHQNIVPVYDYGTQGGISYVVMRLLSGGTLADRLVHSIEDDRPLPTLQEVSQTIRLLASALDYAHSKGVIHRDIKANNIMFDAQGTPFIVDFGIAKLLNATSALTGTGVAMGTPSYMAPEQWQGGDIGPAADQYALAVLVYTMLTGKMPFEADSPYQLMHKHLFDNPTPIHNHRADLPEAVQKVFDRAFNKYPIERFPNTSEFAKAFDDAVKSGPVQQPSGFFLTPLPIRRLNIPLQPTPPAKPDLEGPTVTPPNLQVPDPILPTVPDIPAKPPTPPTGSGLSSTVPPPPAAAVASTRRGRLPLAALGLLAAIIMIAIIVFVLVDGGGDDEGGGQSRSGSTSTATETSDPVRIAQSLLTITAEAQISLVDETQTIEAVFTQIAKTSEAHQTATAEAGGAVGGQVTDTATATSSPSSTATVTATSSMITSTNALAPSRSTSTPTRTSTPNAVETLEARATRDFERTVEAQGQPESSPTATPTPTVTRTSSPSSTVTRFPSSTATSTVTPSGTATASPTATATFTPSYSPSPSVTATPTLTFTATRSATPTIDTAATRVAEGATATVHARNTQQAKTQQAATQNSVQTLAARATNDANATQAVRAPTQTAQAIAAAIQIGVTPREVNVRSEPNTAASVVTTLPQGTRLLILGTNEDGTWFNIRLEDGTTGWIRADLLTVLGTPTATPTPSATPELAQFDNVPMVLVPAGCFTMGSTQEQVDYALSIDTNPDVLGWEQPATEICFDEPFWIDQYEVTNAQFGALNGQAGRENSFTDPQQPRGNVTWNEAREFCAMRGGRLPTEAEWEYAARGPENRIFPWGNELDPDRFVFVGNATEPATVGSQPDGISWVGAYDFAGNVWEWVNSHFAPYPFDPTDGREAEDVAENPVLRGGSYQDTEGFARTSMRAVWVPAETAVEVIGFRCVRDFDAGE